MIKKDFHPNGTKSVRGTTQVALSQLYVLYRVLPSDSSPATPERNSLGFHRLAPTACSLRKASYDYSHSSC